MKPFARYIVGAVSFALIAYLFATMPFGDRGYHFVAEATAEEASEGGGDYDLSRLRVLTRCVGYVRSYYVDPARIDPREMLVGSLEEVQRIVPPLRVTVQRGEGGAGRPNSVNVSVYDQSERFELGKIDDLYEMNWKLLDVFDFIDRRLRPEDRQPRIEYAAINGMLSTLDPHSVLLDPDVYREMKLGTAGEFGGLGVVISIRGGQLSVVSVIEDTPAYRARLKTGDRIVQIGEESSVNMTLNEAVNLLRGAPGSPVTIWVEREGWAEPRSFTIERANITIRSAEGHALGRGVGYVRLKHFQQNTFAELTTELTKLRASGHWRGLILDLRDNPGGLLDQAILVSDAFLSEGTIVTTVGAGSKLREEKKATEQGTFRDIPIVVLVNAGSASASEIVAGALKNNNRALVLGERSFGKGSVQVLYDIDDAALKLTIAQYLTPGDQSIQSVGIVPDVLTVPVVIGEDYVDLFATDRDKRGESDLPKHLVHQRARTDVRPEVVLKYLREEESSSSDDESKDELHKDKPIAFAEALLTRVDSPDRRALLPVAKELFAELAREEDGAVRGELRKLGVDWRPSPPEGERRMLAPRLKIDMTTLPASGVVTAGEALELHVSVRNDGTKPLYRVHAFTRSTYGRFDNRELVFGRIGPGETRSWTLKMKVSRAAPTREDDLVVELFSDGAPLDRLVKRRVSVEALPRPSFAFSLQVRDDRDGADESADALSGNGDGMIQRGERVRLRLRIHNFGAGVAREGFATLKNASGDGVFIHAGRVSFDPLDPGGVTHVEFDVEVKPSFEGEVAKLDVSIFDAALREQMKQLIQLKIMPPSTGGSSPYEARRVVARRVALHAAASADSPLLGVLGAGVVETVARAGAFVRLRLGGAEEAWVAEADLGGPAPAGVAGAAPFTPRDDDIPPTIQLAEDETRPIYTKADTFSLDATVHFPAAPAGEARVAYVYVGDRKLFFQEHRAPGGEASAEPGDSAVDLPLKVSVPLEPGVNRVTIHARCGDTSPVYRVLIVHRSGKGPDAISEVR